MQNSKNVNVPDSVCICNYYKPLLKFALLIANTPKSPTEFVSVFIDNSNILIEGKYTVGDIEEAGVYDRQRKSHHISQLRLDHGRLLKTVLKGQKMGSNPIIVSSYPPKDDEIWAQAKKDGFTVIVYDRNCVNKEKKVDTSLVIAGMRVIYKKDPGIFVLIANDSVYEPIVNEAIQSKWKSEI